MRLFFKMVRKLQLVKDVVAVVVAGGWWFATVEPLLSATALTLPSAYTIAELTENMAGKRFP